MPVHSKLTLSLPRVSGLVPPGIDSDTLRFMADRQDDRARQLTMESRAARTRARLFREIAATFKEMSCSDILALLNTPELDEPNSHGSEP